MTLAGRFALLLLTAAGGFACHSEKDLLASRDGGTGGVSGAGGAGAGGKGSGGGAGGGGVGGGSPMGGAGASGGRGGSGGAMLPPPAPSHARTTDPGLPAGHWVDRTPCRLPFAWPPALPAARVAFDSDRRRVVVMGTSGLLPLDVWELDPATGAWQDRSPCDLPASWPSPEAQTVLGYDRGRRKMVLLAGMGGENYQTWEWDGQTGTWELRASGFFPVTDAVTGTTVLEYDPQRQTMVLPGWALYDWNGAAGTWTQRWVSPITGSPLIRTTFSTRASFAYDPDRSMVLTFGGEGGTFIHELWETNGARWIDRTPPQLPAAWPTGRSDARLFYEPTTRKMILAGGVGGSRDDLWAFDATTGVFTAAPPEPASWSFPGYAFAATAGGGQVMVFESTSADAYLGHVLSWNVPAGPVTDLRPAHVPVSWPLTSVAIAAAYDVRRGRVVMFGGQGDGTTNGTSVNLLEWNGQDGTWQDRTPPRTAQVAWPPSRRHHAMASDSRRGLILVFGGDQVVPDTGFTSPLPFLGPTLSDYWEWDGQAGRFTERSPAAAAADWPPASVGFAAGNMTYDEARDRVVLVDAVGFGPWEWDPVSWTWTPPPRSTTDVGGGASLMYGPRGATTFAVGGPNTGAVAVTSWTPAARTWTTRLPPDYNVPGPRWSFDGSAAVIDPISGVVWLMSNGVWSWQAGASTWTDRSSIAMPPTMGNPISGNVLVFDERRGTLVLLGPGGSLRSHTGGIGVWELAVP